MNDDVQRMRERMKDVEPSEQGHVWDSLWQDGVTPWDLGHPTPALISEVMAAEMMMRRGRHNNLATSTTNATSARFRTTLLPGCGSGYDLVALAQCFDTMDAHRKDDDDDDDDDSLSKKNADAIVSDAHGGRQRRTIVGVDISSHSLERAKNVWENHLRMYGPTKTNIQLYRGDFFESPTQWEPVILPLAEEMASAGTMKNATTTTTTITPSIPSNTMAPLEYDLIIDYLFFCALPPSLRLAWGQTISQLLLSKKDDDDEEEENNEGSASWFSRHPTTPNNDKQLSSFTTTTSRVRTTNPSLVLTIMFPYYCYNDNDNDDDDPLLNNDESFQSQQRRKVMKGPPYPVCLKDYQQVLEPFGLRMTKECRGMPYESPDTIPARRGQEVVAWWTL